MTNSQEGSVCDLHSVEMIDIFTDMKIFMGSILASVILTLPAISIYCRNTEEKPSRSYFGSCVVKFITSFFTSSAIVGGFIVYYHECESRSGWPTRSFLAIVLVEAVEFIFDFGRLVLFFTDPGKLDVYQNVRWNSRGFEIRCPMYILMTAMWLFILYANAGKFIYGSVYSDDDDSNDDNVLNLFWWNSLVIFGILSFSVTGAYNLLRMRCWEFDNNEGEETGQGFYWSRFKVTALDMPSFLTAVLINGSSSLVFFWTAEFFNDVFPYIATVAFPYIVMVAEKYLIKEEMEEDEEEGEGNDGNIPNSDADGIPLTRLNKQRRLWFTRLAKYFTKEENEEEGEGNDGSIQMMNPYGIIVEENVSTTTVHIGRLLDVDHRHTQPTSERKMYRVDRSFPANLTDEITDIQWGELCDKIDGILDTINASSQYMEYTAGRSSIKAKFIALGLLLSTLFWVFRCLYYLSEGGTLVRWKPWLLFAMIFIIIEWTIIKACFRIRDLPSQVEVLEKIEHVCNSETADNVHFQFRMEKLFEIKALIKWCLRGGFTCAQGIRSIRYLECNVTSDAMEQEALFPIGVPVATTTS